MESLTGLDGEQSFKESWKGLGKDTIHWDEWSKNPFKAAGETAVDRATMPLPGGPLEKIPKLGRAAADVAKDQGISSSHGPPRTRAVPWQPSSTDDAQKAKAQYPRPTRTLRHTAKPKPS